MTADEPTRSYAFHIENGRSLDDLAGDFDRQNRLLGGAEPQEFGDRVPTIASESLARLGKVAAGVDVVDLLLACRAHVMPHDVEQMHESVRVPVPAALEAIQLALLSAEINQDTAPHTTPDLHARATEAFAYGAELAEAAVMYAIFLKDRSRHELAELAARFLANQVSIRGHQWTSVRRQTDDRILRHPSVVDVFREKMGLPYDDFNKVADALEQNLRDKREWIGGLLEAESSASGWLARRALRRKLSRVLDDLAHHPSKIASINIKGIMSSTGVSHATAVTALDLMTWQPEQGHPAESYLTDFILGRDPVGGRPLIKGNDSQYFYIGSARFERIRQEFENRLKRDTRSWARYSSVRASTAEDRAVALISELLGGTDPVWKNYKYQPSAEPGESSGQAESDALFVVDDIAFCIEVKAGEITQKSRTGMLQSMLTDMRKTVVEASDQAQRLRRSITNLGGVLGANGEWIDLSHVLEVHSIVVSLDILGPLSASSEQLVRAGVLRDSPIPWIITLHDLSIINSILDHPAQFVSYLRRRTTIEAATAIQASDELDLFMWFIKGQFDLEPDPGLIWKRRSYPGKPPRAMVERYQAQQATTVVGTFTDDLDAWLSVKEGISHSAPRPSREEEPEIQHLLTYFERGRPDGWLPVSASLVDLPREIQKRLCLSLQEILDKHRLDGETHSVTFSNDAQWGPCLVLPTVEGVGISADESARIVRFLEQKKYQLAADRAMLIILDGNGSVRSTVWRSKAWCRDAEIEKELVRNGMADQGLLHPPVKRPPHARRKTKRLRGRRRRA